MTKLAGVIVWCWCYRTWLIKTLWDQLCLYDVEMFTVSVHPELSIKTLNRWLNAFS